MNSKATNFQLLHRRIIISLTAMVGDQTKGETIIVEGLERTKSERKSLVYAHQKSNLSKVFSLESGNVVSKS